MSAGTKTPAETLRAAAALLRERSAKATPGPWNYCRIDGDGETPELAEVFAGPIDGYGYLAGSVASWSEEDEDGQRLSYEDGDWLHAMHPGVGEPLAAALEFAAEVTELPWQSGTPSAALVIRMLAVARVVLREEPTAVTA